MAIADTRLTLMSFPQRVDGGRLSLRLLTVPTTNPLSAPASGVAPFADGPLAVHVRLVRGLNDLPTMGAGELLGTFSLAAQPNARAIFEALSDAYPGAANPPPPLPMPKLRILKVASPAYLAAAGASRLNSPDLIPAEDYACAVHRALDPANRPPRPPATGDLSWNQIFARCLRQPLLAESLGLVRRLDINLPDPEALKDGGYLWVEPATGSPWQAAVAATPDCVRQYAARLPRIGAGAKRPLFAAVHFPVKAVAATGAGYDLIISEADAFSDGFARIVHAAQPNRHDPYNIARARSVVPPASDRGIRLGWDDEQLLVWLNRQLTEDPRIAAPGASRDAPSGVLGWRIDVREVDEGVPGPWHSLNRVEGELVIGTIELGSFDGEHGVEMPPSVQSRVDLGGGNHVDHAWLSAEGLRWAGGSLLGFDPIRTAITGRSLNAALKPLGADVVTLCYGGSYEFRVRMMDLSGGGPSFEDEPVNQGVQRTARCRYRRYASPQAAQVSAPSRDADARRISFTVRRPAIGYPDALYVAGDRDAVKSALIDQAGEIADGRMELAVPDADITHLRVSVSVGIPQGDPDNIALEGAPRRRLFGGPIVRPFPDDLDGSLDLGFAFVDIEDVDELEAPGALGDITVPSNRDIFVDLAPLCREDPAMVLGGREDPLLIDGLAPSELMEADDTLDYFGTQAARLGPTQQFQLREPGRNESALLVAAGDHQPLSAVLIARSSLPAGLSAVARLAEALGLRHDGMMLKAPPGERIVIGCTSRLAHVADAARASLTFTSEADLTDRWIVPVRLELARDWSWNGLSPQGLAIHRRDDAGGETTGRLPLPPFLAADAAATPPQRGHVSMLFLDLVEPSVEGRHPAERNLEYRVDAELRNAAETPPDPWTGAIRLPIGRSPADRPVVISAGIAQSPYGRDEKYSRTTRRDRVLWLEFARPPLNPADIICGRVVGWAADPALTSDFPDASDQPVPALAIPDEPIRVIVPDQPDDQSGADAMQPLTPTRSPVRFLLPLPPGIDAASSQLFGFFRYEFRFAHGPDSWSTARARFGDASVIDSIRHIPPQLECGASRVDDLVVTYAAPARPAAPDRGPDLDRSVETDIWFLLFGQAIMADGSDFRNVLLSRRRGQISEGAGLHPAMPRLRAAWHREEIEARLMALALRPSTPLSVLAVELLVPPGDLFPDPVAGDLGEVSVLRSSTLVPIPAGCTA